MCSSDLVSEAVIGSGKAYKILDWLSYCFESVGLNWEEAVVLEENYISPYQILVSDPKLITDLGWRPMTSMYQLANMMLND